MTRLLRLYWIPLLGFAVALGLHLWRLDVPSRIVSDEHYFVQDGLNYLGGKFYVDAHPPLGKLQLGAMFELFGSSPLTWRVLNALLGALLVPLLWWIAKTVLNRRAAWMMVMLVLTDGFLLTESRLGLINMPYILYSFAAVAAALQSLRSKRVWPWLLAQGIFTGAALSVKWLAVLIVGPALLLSLWPAIFGWQRQAAWQTREHISAIILLAGSSLLIYLSAWWIHFWWLHRETDIVRHHVHLWLHHTTEKTGHLYRELWWRWPLLWQPFLYHWERTGNAISVMWSMGNPWVWWTGALALSWSVITKWREHRFRFLIIFLLFSWLPFALIQRDMFSYHAIPFGVFLFLIVAALLDRWWSRYRTFVIAYVAMAVLVFFWFAPWWLNLPLSQDHYRLRQWLPTWQVKTPR